MIAAVVSVVLSCAHLIVRMCCYQRGIRYGQESREWLDLLVPDSASVTAPGFCAGLYRMVRNRPVAVPEGVQEAVLFIHGGEACCCELLRGG